MLSIGEFTSLTLQLSIFMNLLFTASANALYQCIQSCIENAPQMLSIGAFTIVTVLQLLGIDAFIFGAAQAPQMLLISAFSSAL